MLTKIKKHKVLHYFFFTLFFFTLTFWILCFMSIVVSKNLNDKSWKHFISCTFSTSILFYSFFSLLLLLALFYISFNIIIFLLILTYGYFLFIIYSLYIVNVKIVSSNDHIFRLQKHFQFYTFNSMYIKEKAFPKTRLWIF